MASEKRKIEELSDDEFNAFKKDLSESATRLIDDIGTIADKYNADKGDAVVWSMGKLAFIYGNISSGYYKMKAMVDEPNE